MADKRVNGQPATYDVAIIGGGVVGCATARRFTLEGVRVALLERGADILSGASKANSAILHTGFDAPADSLELHCIRRGYEEYCQIRNRLGLPLLATSAVVVAWDREQADRLDPIVEAALANGINDVRAVDAAELYTLIPHLAEGARAGVLVPGEAVIDPWSAPLAYIRQAASNGAHVLLDSEVLGGRFAGGRWTLDTAARPVNARVVINCAGLYADRVNRHLLGSADFEIRPRKGQFLVFDKAARRHVERIILPVPSARTKGVLIAPTVFGNVLVGPTAEEQDDRDHARLDTPALEALREAAVRSVPALADVPVTAAYAGLRPATERKEYRVEVDAERQWISVAGVRSTGLSAALGLAHHVYGLYGVLGAQHTAIAAPAWPRVPNLAEDGERDWMRAGYGEIVCHCELVTRREIEDALAAPLGAVDMGGLKRRTRATMGRCQGFYCSARIAELTRGRMRDSLVAGDSRGHG